MIKFTEDLCNSKLRTKAEQLTKVLSSYLKAHPELNVKIDSMDRENSSCISVYFSITNDASTE